MVQKLEFQIEAVCVFCEVGTAKCRFCETKVTNGKVLNSLRYNISSIFLSSNVQILSFLNHHFVKIWSNRTIKHEKELSVREKDQQDAHFSSLIYSN
jgi:hypothetical protein